MAKEQFVNFNDGGADDSLPECRLICFYNSPGHFPRM